MSKITPKVFYNSLIRADQVLDFIPGGSSVSNPINLVLKKALPLAKLSTDNSLNARRYYQHLHNKKTLRCVGLTIPIFNIGVAIYFLAKDQHQRKLERTARTQALASQALRRGIEEIQQGNQDEAVRCFGQSASLGNAKGMFNLALAYEHGLGNLPQDPKKARHLFKKAAYKGLTPAMTKLAYMYSQAEAKNRFQANIRNIKMLWWLEKSAVRGDPIGMYLLGLWLEQDKVMPRKEEALKWFTKSAQAGFELAIKKLQEIEEQSKKDNA